MCGRYALFSVDLLRNLGVELPQGLPPARYNIAPTQRIAIRRKESLEPARWGLIPHWKKTLDGPPLFNARVETVAEKPSFRDAYQSGRCVVPMDGYYEWKDSQPHFVTGPDGLLWAAGLWASGLGQLSATVVTAAATEEMEWLHHRQPKFLLPDEVQAWLAGADLGGPTSVRGLSTYPVDKAVGNVRNDYPGLIEPVDKS
ncbi:hypothetical protein CPHO_09500 [Corynebacterium phocae]|uniref:Abasic site processing protein n=1 Tax=Corynebacterium phocae TaxID=161895 RepID=A0A1L7D4W4_9CORY|nr:SOS response-associated peptidase [Corynebacterium phocae]APT93081.1 hypothetical protein CPHO_09500 [Corynebacterium phocae]KAA8722383.1 SOS response-associated peptidase [Corynebacterium phocae]